MVTLAMKSLHEIKHNVRFFFQSLETSSSHVNVNDFDFIRVIGRGSYAKVIYVSLILILKRFWFSNNLQGNRVNL